MNNKKFFCVIPWTEALLNYDHVLPCCEIQSKSDVTLNNYLESDYLNNIKNNLLEGKIPKGCEICDRKEKSSGYSLRLNALQHHHDEKNKILEGKWDSNHFYNILINTSNICNLKCLPCSHPSFIRFKELKTLNLESETPILVITNKNIEYLDKITFEKITLSGGEPFLDEVSFKILEKIALKENSKNIIIDINSNFTKISEDKLKFLSENFNKINLKASVDGVGKINDYLRYPSDWDTIENNINLVKQFSNIDLMITTALSNLSFLRYYEVLEWVEKNNFSKCFLSLVSKPKVLNSNIVPIEIKKLLRPKFEKFLSSDNNIGNFKNCVNSCLTICDDPVDYSLQWNDTLKWVQLHDNLRNTNLYSVFEELKNYVKT